MNWSRKVWLLELAHSSVLSNPIFLSYDELLFFLMEYSLLSALKLKPKNYWSEFLLIFKWLVFSFFIISSSYAFLLMILLFSDRSYSIFYLSLEIYLFLHSSMPVCEAGWQVQGGLSHYCVLDRVDLMFRGCWWSEFFFNISLRFFLSIYASVWKFSVFSIRSDWF